MTPSKTSKFQKLGDDGTKNTTETSDNLTSIGLLIQCVCAMRWPSYINRFTQKHYN